VSFEPVKQSYDVLCETARTRGDWQCRDVGLGSREAQAKIYRTRNSVFDSLLPPNQYCRHEFEADSEVIGRETISLRPLDALFEECVGSLGAPKVFLKLDTQGHDMEVLAGATSSIPRIAAIQTEVSLKPIYDGMPDYLTSLRRLNVLGFEITGLFPVNRDSGLRVIEFDCVALRSEMR
jgi:FkbM family methyltransferase